MSEANISATNQDGLLEITDGSRSYYLDLEPGDFKWQIGKTAPTVNLTRGKVSPLMGGAPDMRASDEAPVTGSLSFRLRSLYSTTATTLKDLLSWLAGDVSTSNYVAGNWLSTHPYSDVRSLTLKYHVSGVYRGVPDATEVFSYTAFHDLAYQEGNPTVGTVNFTSGIVKPSQE